MTYNDNLIYLAAVVDCEGCIGLTGRTEAARLHGPRYSSEAQGRIYAEYRRITMFVSVGMSVHSIPFDLHMEFGGTLSFRKMGSNRKDMWHWRVSNNKALDCINALYPYLRIKRPQAEVAIAFQESRSQNGRPTTVVQKEADEILLAKAHELNKTGK